MEFALFVLAHGLWLLFGWLGHHVYCKTLLGMRDRPSYQEDLWFSRCMTLFGPIYCLAVTVVLGMEIDDGIRKLKK